MERGDRSEGTADDGSYPPAPLPAHERAWRHPSELGQADWMATEPPLAIGKGVMVATGAIGTVLGLAVLWMLVPAGMPTAPAAAPAVSQSMQSASSPAPIRAAVGPTTTEAPAPSSSLAPSTVPTDRVPSNTLHVMRPATDDPAQAPPAAIAVTIGETTLLITTAAAVGGGAAGDPITLNDASDEAHLATVAQTMGDMVVLEASSDTTDALGATAFTAVAAAAPDQPVLVLTTEPIAVPFVADGAPLDLATVGDEIDDVAEGTPVVDESGALVALCTRRVDDAGELEIAFVPVADVLRDVAGATEAERPTDTAPSSTDPTRPPDTAAPSAWLGVVLGLDEARAGAVVNAVVPDSPAAVAGLVAGARITAVDGRPVLGHESLLAIVREAVPGQTLLVTAVVPASTGGEVTRTLSVLLAAAAPSA